MHPLCVTSASAFNMVTGHSVAHGVELETGIDTGRSGTARIQTKHQLLRQKKRPAIALGQRVLTIQSTE
jgi:hypothetical protein